MSRLALWDLIVRLWFDGMDNIGELDSVLNEKHRNIISDYVPISFVGIHLNCESTHIANRILNMNQILLDTLEGIKQLTALPRDPWTVLKRTKTGVVREGSVKTGAWVYFEALLSNTLKYPCAPAPRA